MAGNCPCQLGSLGVNHQNLGGIPDGTGTGSYPKGVYSSRGDSQRPPTSILKKVNSSSGGPVVKGDIIEACLAYRERSIRFAGIQLTTDRKGYPENDRVDTKFSGSPARWRWYSTRPHGNLTVVA